FITTATAANAFPRTYCRRNVIISAPIPMSGWINPAASFSIRTGRVGVERHPLRHTMSSRIGKKEKAARAAFFYVLFPGLIFNDFAVIALGFDDLFLEITLLKN